MPDMLIREENLDRDLSWLSQTMGLGDMPPVQPAAALPAFLSAPEIRKATRAAYLRDYVAFGFGTQLPE